MRYDLTHGLTHSYQLCVHQLQASIFPRQLPAHFELLKIGSLKFSVQFASRESINKFASYALYQQFNPVGPSCTICATNSTGSPISPLRNWLAIKYPLLRLNRFNLNTLFSFSWICSSFFYPTQFWLGTKKSIIGTWQDGKRVHCKYLPLSHIKP